MQTFNLVDSWINLNLSLAKPVAIFMINCNNGGKAALIPVCSTSKSTTVCKYVGE